MRKYIQWLWPNYCLLCRSITSDLAICQDCIDELPWNKHGCYQCGLPIEGKRSSMLCGVCLTKPPPFNHTLALLTYIPPITRFITQLKFNRQLLYANMLGNLLAEKIKISKIQSPNSWPDCIIPVPLHRRRLRQRGFNQALEIAKPIAKKLHLPLDYKSCIRSKDTQPQSELPAKKRHHNLKNAFALKKSIATKRVAIIDDVMTTGNTLIELSKLLRKNGVEHIEVWCCARAVWRG